MRIQHNITAMNAYRNYTGNASKLSKNLEKLSSGYKINRAGDDAAGLAISEKMRSQITGLNAAQKNVKDGISLVKTAEGALQEVHDMLNRMTYLATQSANGTYDNEVDRNNLQKELDALRTEIDRIADSSNFNGQKLLDGSLGAGSYTAGTAVDADATVAAAGVTWDATYTLTNGDVTGIKGAFASEVSKALGALKSGMTGAEAKSVIEAAIKQGVATANGDSLKENKNYDHYSNIAVDFQTGKIVVNHTKTAQTFAQGSSLGLQIGDTADSFNQMSVGIESMKSGMLGIGAISIASQADAQNAVKAIKDAINTVSSTRGDLGALQNRLEHTGNNLAVMKENIQDAESTIRDTDVADEMTDYTKNNILLQSAQAMLAQANQMPQGVLQLLQ